MRKWRCTTWWLVTSMVLGFLVPVTSAEQVRSGAVAALSPAPPPAQHFNLGLDREVEQRFRLFGGRDGGPVVADEPPTVARSADGEPTLTASLVYSPDEMPIPDDLRINLKPRTWGDLDGWERLGVVLGYAGTVAGAAYIAKRIVD